MPRNARIPSIDLTDRRLLEAHRLMAEVADERCGDPSDFMARSKAARHVTNDVLWIDEQVRLEEAVTTAPTLTVEGEEYRRLKQHSSAIYHGLFGGHLVKEPLYRRVGIRNGPTLKPLTITVGIVDGSLLPDLAEGAGGLMALVTSREAETVLERLGFRPPSRTTLEHRVGGLFSDMATGARELESACRQEEELDFELGVVTCGLDRFAVRMDETLPDGPERDAKLAKRRPPEQYERTPPEPYDSNWRMAWAANVTLYDDKGRPRRSYRYGADAGHDVEMLVARVVDDIIHHTGQRRDVPVACIQDGAGDLEPLRRELRERLPEGVPRWEIVDFHHAIGYLDAVVAADDAAHHDGMAGWYRLKLLKDPNGAADIVEHLRRRVGALDDSPPALAAALTYFEKRRPAMKYAKAQAEQIPIGSGATEATCALFQLRVKHPGSHWRPRGLRGAMTARGFHLSERWDLAFRIHHTSLRQEVQSVRLN
jgi:hypothetical protein